MPTDAEMIDKLGGPTRVAGILAYPEPGGRSRVANWKRRGIPPAVKLKHPALFVPDWRPARNKAKAAA